MGIPRESHGNGNSHSHAHLYLRYSRVTGRRCLAHSGAGWASSTCCTGRRSGTPRVWTGTTTNGRTTRSRPYARLCSWRKCCESTASRRTTPTFGTSTATSAGASMVHTCGLAGARGHVLTRVCCSFVCLSVGRISSKVVVGGFSWNVWNR